MTTIVYDGRYIACDGRSTMSNLVTGSNTQKLFEIGVTVNGFQSPGVLAGAGTLQSLIRLKRHLEVNDLVSHGAQELMLDEGTLQAVLVLDNGETYTFEDGSLALPAEYPLALGSGTDFALGAVLSGKSAYEAVKIACSLDVYSGGGIKVFDTLEWGYVMPDQIEKRS